ncbi:MAG: Rnase Y domain-containing protein [Caldilineaceae bacterium]
MGTMILAIILIALVAIVAAGIAAYLAYDRGRKSGIEGERQRQAEMRMGAEEQAARIIAEAETGAKQLQLAIKEEEVSRRAAMDTEQERRRKELERIEERLQNRLDTAERRLEQMENRERKLNQRSSKLDQREQQLSQMEEERAAELQRVAQMSTDEAREVLLADVRETTRNEMARAIREIESETMEEADRRVRSWPWPSSASPATMSRSTRSAASHSRPMR